MNVAYFDFGLRILDFGFRLTHIPRSTYSLL